MWGAMVTLLEDIDPAYYKYSIYIDISGNKYMYAEAKRVVYSTLEAALLSWTKIYKSL